MHESVLQWADPLLDDELCYGANVLEIGSYNVNGSLRPMVERHNPYQYHGIDITAGPGVDEVRHAVDPFPLRWSGYWDLVICTEVLEHVDRWAHVLANISHALRRGGTAIITTRSIGFPYHAYPDDYWRYNPDEFAAVMGIFGIRGQVTRDHPTSPGLLYHGIRSDVHIGPYDLRATAERMELYPEMYGVTPVAKS